jgi:hypothetical protein
MERFPMLMDWQNQHSEDGYITKSNLYVQHNSYQNSNGIHHRDWKINPKVHLEMQKTMNSNAILSIKSNTGGITIPDFKLYYRAIAQKQIKRPLQWSKIEELGINSCSYTHLIFDKGAKNICWRKPLQKKSCWENRISACRKMKLDSCLYTAQISTQNGLRTFI